MPRSLALQRPLFDARHQIWCVQRPSFRPEYRFSTAYCLWLAKSPRQRDEVLQRQGYKCWAWDCRKGLLNPRWVHLHHPLGYRDLDTGENIVGYENPSELVGMHADCHARAHRQEYLTRQRTSVCGCVSQPP